MTQILNNFFTVSNQVLVLFILIAIGFICGKLKIINDKVSSGMSDIAIYFATPAVIISSFLRPFDKSMFKNQLIAFGIAIAFHIIAIAVSYIFVKNKDENICSVNRFCVIFSNAGFMALPLQKAILGDDGVFYGSAYVVIFNIVVWTFGLILMGKKGTKITVKKLIFNPGVIGVTVGMILFLLNLYEFVPTSVSGALSHVANLNTPIPMFVIGYYLSKDSLLSAVTDKRIYLSVFLRLILVPCLCLTFLYFLKPYYTISIASMVAVSAPIAAITTIFAAKFSKDTTLSAKAVSVSTLLSVLTIPMFVAVAQELLK